MKETRRGHMIEGQKERTKSGVRNAKRCQKREKVKSEAADLITRMPLR